METICVDLNGVLDQYGGWQGLTSVGYPPAQGARTFLEKLHALGYRIVILSAWTGARAWIQRNGFGDLVDEVTDRKVPAIAYVDNRAMRFDGDFDKVVDVICGVCS